MKKKEIEVKTAFHENGQIESECFFLGYLAHNPNGPAIRVWNRNGILVIEKYAIKGKYHREDGPAIRFWNGVELIKEAYLINHKFHREDGPAVRHWFNKSHYYYHHNIIGNSPEPKLRLEEGNEYYEINLINGKLTRINGFAFRLYIDEELVYQI